MKRRKYQKDYTAFARVIALTEMFNENELTDLFLPIRTSFEALKTGSGTERDVSDLIAVMNNTSVRAHEISQDLVPTTDAAIYALNRCVERHSKTGKWGFDGPALAEIEQGIDLHEQMCRLSTPRQMRNAALKVQEIRKWAQDQTHTS